MERGIISYPAGNNDSSRHIAIYCNIGKTKSTKVQQQEWEQWDKSTKGHVVNQEGEVLVTRSRLWFQRTILSHQGIEHNFLFKE